MHEYKTAEINTQHKISGSAGYVASFNPAAAINYRATDQTSFLNTAPVTGLFDYDMPAYYVNINYVFNKYFEVGCSIKEGFLASLGGGIDVNLNFINIDDRFMVSIFPDIGFVNTYGSITSWGTLFFSTSTEAYGYTSKSYMVNVPLVLSYRFDDLFLLNFGPEITIGDFTIYSSYKETITDGKGNIDQQTELVGNKKISYVNPGVFVSLAIGKPDKPKFFIMLTAEQIIDIYDQQKRILLYPGFGVSF